MGGVEVIVCVDDEVIILMALRQELTRSLGGRFRVETATGAREALELIDRLFAEGARVLLVLTDWLMPGIKGDELAVAVKREHPEVRCVLVSGQADARAVAEARLQTVLDAFVRKPWRSDYLLETVRRYVEAPGASPPG